MSYPGYPPYGQPPPQPGGYYPQQGQGAPPQPPPGQYGYAPPPPQPYGSPAPPPQPQQPYGAAPPPGQYPPYYGQTPPAQYPPNYPPAPQQPYGAPAYGGQYGQPPAPGYGAPPPQPYGGAPPPPPPQQQYGAPAPLYGSPPYGNYPPTPPSLGYGPPQAIRWDASADADALRQAMKGFGTDEKALIRALATKDPLQIPAIKEAYHRLHRRDLEADIRSETTGHLERGLLALCDGPLMQDVHLLHEALSGPGTKELALNDVLLARSNADLRAIKAAYHHNYHRSLDEAVRADLSMKTERHFMIVLQATRAEDSVPVNKPDVDRDVVEIYNATEGKLGTDEMKVCSILSTRNDDQIRAIAHEYQQKFARSLEDVIRREFSGHMEDALLFQLRHGLDKYMHQASLLEAAMAGAGTRDHLLIARVVRCHWDGNNMANVRGAFERRYRASLAGRIRGETSGDYERLLLACIGDHV